MKEREPHCGSPRSMGQCSSFEPRPHRTFTGERTKAKLASAETVRRPSGPRGRGNPHTIPDTLGARKHPRWVPELRLTEHTRYLRPAPTHLGGRTRYCAVARSTQWSEWYSCTESPTALRCNLHRCSAGSSGTPYSAEPRSIARFQSCPVPGFARNTGRTRSRSHKECREPQSYKHRPL